MFKEKIIKIAQSAEFKYLSKHLISIQISFIALQFIVLSLSKVVKSGLFFPHTLVFIPIWASYLFFKDAQKNESRIPLFLAKISFPLYISFILLSGINSIEPISGQSKGTGVFGIMLSFVSFLLFATLFMSEKGKNMIEKIEDTNILESLVGAQPEEILPGDAVIGKKIEFKYQENGEKRYTLTNLPARLPMKDRYLHMLILGPTGSGKTSQVILPMIWRDMNNPDLGIIALEPKGDLAEKVYAMAKLKNREVQYFNPVHPDCPYFNPLCGLEEDVIENMATTFKMLDNDSAQYFQNMSENLIRNSLKVLKRLYKDDATMLDLSTLVHNNEGRGKKIVQEFSQLQVETQEIQKENDDIVAWFFSDYFTGSTGDNRNATKTYEHCSGVRNQIAKLVSNKFLRRVLNPPKGHGSDIDFDRCLAEGTVITIATAQGKLRDLGRFLGYFLILQLQSSVFKRPGNENTRRGSMLFIDEFQVYSNPGFADMLTQGRSYRVASHLATQARDQIGMGSGKEGEAFIQLVSSNARNIIFYPGGNHDDARYYSDYFGEEMVKTKQIGMSQQKMGLGNLIQYRPVNESLRDTEAFTSRFSPTDLIYRKFGEITYLFIRQNSIDRAGVAQVEFIPREIDNELDAMVSAYNLKQEEGANPVKNDLHEIEAGTPTTEEAKDTAFKPVFLDLDEDDFSLPGAGNIIAGTKNAFVSQSTESDEEF